MKRNGLTMFCQGLWQVLIWSYTCRLKVLKSEKWHFFLLLQRLMKHAEIVLGSLACNLITLVSTLQRPKSDILSFFKFLQESFPALQKSFCTFFCNFVGFNLQKICSKTFRFIKWEQETSFLKWGNSFLQKFERDKISYSVPMECWDSLSSGHLG